MQQEHLVFCIIFQQVIPPLLYSWQLFEYYHVKHGNQLGRPP